MIDNSESKPGEKKPVNEKSPGFISKIYNWTKESLTRKILVCGLAGSIIVGAIDYTPPSHNFFTKFITSDEQISDEQIPPSNPGPQPDAKECIGYFDYNISDKLNDKDKLKECVKELPKEGKYIIIGSASKEGSAASNYKLGESRANSKDLEDILKENNMTNLERKSIGRQTQFDPLAKYGPGSVNKNRAVIITAEKDKYNLVDSDKNVTSNNINHINRRASSQCNDHKDNDGDTLVDMDDNDCSSKKDKSEYFIGQTPAGQTPAGQTPTDDTGNGDNNKKPGDKDDGNKQLPNSGDSLYSPIEPQFDENKPAKFGISKDYITKNPALKIGLEVYDKENPSGKPIKEFYDSDFNKVDEDGNRFYDTKDSNLPEHPEKNKNYGARILLDKNGDGTIDEIVDKDDTLQKVDKSNINDKPANIENKTENKYKNAPAKTDIKPEKKGEPRGKSRHDLYEQIIEQSCEENPAYCKNKELQEIKQEDYLKNKGGSLYIAPGLGISKEILSQMMVTYTDGTDVASLDMDNTLAYTVRKNPKVKDDANGNEKQNLECKTKDVNFSWKRDGLFRNKKGNFDINNEISGKPGDYIIKADQNVEYRITDNKGNSVKAHSDGKNLTFELNKDVQSVNINTVYKEKEKECAKKNLVIKNNKFKVKPIINKDGDATKDIEKSKEEPSNNIKDMVKRTGVFAGVTTGSYHKTYKNDSTDTTYKGDSQTIGAGIAIKPTENIKITPYATQTKIKANVADTLTGDNFAKVKSENLIVGLNTEFKADKKNSPLDKTKVEVEFDYTKTDSSVDYTNFDIHAKQKQDGFIGIVDVEMPNLFHAPNNVDIGLGLRAVYSQEDGRMIDDSPSPDNTPFKLTKGLYSGKLLFNIDMDSFFIPDNISFDLRYRTIDDIESKETLKGMSLRNMLYFEGGKRIKTYAELFGEFPINGNLEQTNYGAILGWDRFSDHGPLKYLGFEFEGGARKLEKNTSVSKEIIDETYFTAGVKINTDGVLKFLKDPFNR